MFPKARKYLLLENKFKVSRLKVEKVLSPPIIPVVKNSFVLGDILAEFFSSSVIKPIKKPAITFEISVASGNCNGNCKKSLVIANLIQQPINPPIPTIKNSIIFLPFSKIKS